MWSTSEKVRVPIIRREMWFVSHLEDGGNFVYIYDQDGTNIRAIRMSENDNELKQKITEFVSDDNKQCEICILNAMGQNRILSVSEIVDI